MKRIFFLLAAGQGACYAAVLLTGNLRQNIVCAELCFFAAFVLYLVSLLVLRTAENSGMPDGEGAAGTARRFFKKELLSPLHYSFRNLLPGHTLAESAHTV